MAEKTLYDILEVSETASDEAISAAYARLSKRLAADAADAQPDSDASLRYTAVREAFLTLGDPHKRARYDRRLRTEWLAPPPAPFWRLSRTVPILLCLAIAASYLWHDRRQQQALLESQKAIAAAKAREEAAHAESERLRLEREAQAVSAAKADEQQRRARESELRAFESTQRERDRENQAALERERAAKLVAEAQRQRAAQQAAQQAAAAAERQLARDKAELCRIERERYGKALSC